MAQAKRDLSPTEVQGPRLMVPTEAAEFLRISLPQLYHLTSTKRIPFLKVGGQLRFEPEMLLKHLRAAAEIDAAPASGPRSERVIRLDHDRFEFATPRRRR